jgi:hypothetical protein
VPEEAEAHGLSGAQAAIGPVFHGDMARHCVRRGPHHARSIDQVFRPRYSEDVKLMVEYEREVRGGRALDRCGQRPAWRMGVRER